MRFFLNKKLILKSSIEIDSLFKSETVYKGVLFDIIYQPSAEVKVLFAVSKKVKKNVQKKKAKRLLREMFRINQHNIPGCYIIVIIAKQAVLKARFFELNREFQDFINEALR